MVVEPTHLKNMLVKLDHFHKDRGKTKKSFKPPPRQPPCHLNPSLPFLVDMKISPPGSVQRWRTSTWWRSTITWWRTGWSALQIRDWLVKSCRKLPNQKTVTPIMSWYIYMSLWAVYITHVIHWYLLVILVSTKGGLDWVELVVWSDRLTFRLANFWRKPSWSRLVGGFNPFEKYQSKWESSPSRGENKKYLKPPTSRCLSNQLRYSHLPFNKILHWKTISCWWTRLGKTRWDG